MKDEEKTAEDALRRTEENFRSLFDSATDAIFILDLDGNFIDVNKSAYQRLGYTKEEMLALHISQLEPPEYGAKTPERIEQHKKHGHVVFESVHLRKNGTSMPVEVDSRIIDFDGKKVFFSINRDITGRKKAEEALRESEEKYRDLFENANDLIQSVDMEGRLLYVNRKWREVLGYTKEEVNNLTMMDILRKDQLPHCTALLNRVVAGEIVNQTETIFVSKDGREIYVEGNASAQIKDGKFIATRGIFRDITERKKTGEKIITLASIIQTMPDAVCSFDRDGYVLSWNKGAERMLGYTPEDILGKHITVIIPKERAQKEFDHMVTTLNRDGNFTGHETIRIAKDGRLVPVEITAVAMRDNQQNILHYAFIVRDITERKRWEREIQLAYTELDQIFNTAVDGMIVIDRDFNVLRINNTLVSLLGWNNSDSIGKKCYEILSSPDQCHTANCPLKMILSGVPRVEFETGKPRRDGVIIPCIVTAAPFKKPDGEIIGIVEDIRDITELKKKEENTLKTRKLESIGILAGGIAHDFNNLLTVIIGNIGIAKMYVPLGNKAINRLDDAEQICFMASELSKRLITFSSGGEPMKKIVPLSGLIMDAVHTMLKGSPIDIEFDLPDGLHAVSIDEGQMKQVVNNLAINAKEAMPNGGTFIVRGENIRISAQDHSPIREGSYVKISFRDTGVGILSENLAKIFDPYFSTKDTYSQRGLGLGLAVCYSVIKKHDGLITAESEIGKGTIVHIYLPTVGSS
jgi:two-component system, cell cycle sensor histidine kinase and response regulator CckA